MRVTIEQAVKEAVDFPKEKSLIPPHRLAQRIMVAYAEIRDLTAPGNQSMTCVERESTKACLHPLQHAMPVTPRTDSLFTQHIQLGNEGMAEGGRSPAVLLHLKAPYLRSFFLGFFRLARSRLVGRLLCLHPPQ